MSCRFWGILRGPYLATTHGVFGFHLSAIMCWGIKIVASTKIGLKLGENETRKDGNFPIAHNERPTLEKSTNGSLLFKGRLE